MKEGEMTNYVWENPKPFMDAFDVSMMNMKLTLKNSRGEPTMSNDDIKLALIDTMQMLQHQVEINKSLVARLEELEKPKSKIPFKK